MIELSVYDRSGKEVEKIQFDDACLGKFINYELVHQALVMFQANQRTGTHSTKGRRSIVCRKGKPFAQKGTGRARMGYGGRTGSKGGAVAHGPKPRDYRKDMPKKARRAALRSALLGKFRDGEIKVVNELSFTAPKTKDMVATFKGLQIEKSVLVVTRQQDELVFKSARNIERAEIADLAGLNVYNVLKPKQILITKEALQAIPEELK